MEMSCVAVRQQLCPNKLIYLILKEKYSQCQANWEEQYVDLQGPWLEYSYIWNSEELVRSFQQAI